MAELKKCPFCGGEAEIDWYKDSGNETHWFVCCCDCSCELSFGAKISKEQAIEAWNNRATEAEIRAKVIDELLSKMWLKLSVLKKSDMEYWAMLEDLAEQLKERD